MPSRHVNRIFRLPRDIIHKLDEDNAGMMAAGLSYYAFLSILPLVVGLISLLSFILPPETINEAVFSFLQRGLPVSLEFIESNVAGILEARGALGLVSIAGLLFSGTVALSALSLAINRAWSLKPRPIWIRKPQELLAALLLGLIMILALGASVILSMLDNLGLPRIGLILDIAARLGSFLLALTTFLVIYKYVPNTVIRWRSVWPGALLGAVLFELALTGFSFFLQSFANYQLSYGALASVAIFLTWIYISSFILILCAEINAALGRI